MAAFLTGLMLCAGFDDLLLLGRMERGVVELAAACLFAALWVSKP